MSGVTPEGAPMPHVRPATQEERRTAILVLAGFGMQARELKAVLDMLGLDPAEAR